MKSFLALLNNFFRLFIVNRFRLTPSNCIAVAHCKLSSIFSLRKPHLKSMIIVPLVMGMLSTWSADAQSQVQGHGQGAYVWTDNLDVLKLTYYGQVNGETQEKACWNAISLAASIGKISASSFSQLTGIVNCTNPNGGNDVCNAMTANGDHVSCGFTHKLTCSAGETLLTPDISSQICAQCPTGSSLDGSGQCICKLPLIMNGTGTACLTPSTALAGINLGPTASSPITPPDTPPSSSAPASVDLSDSADGVRGGCRNTPASPRVADPINVAIGNLFETEVDYISKVSGNFSLRIERHYNSLSAANDLHFGNNWSSNFDTQVSLSIGNSVATVRFTDGQAISFTSSGGGWVSESLVPATLTANSLGYIFITYDKHQYQFDASGYLTAITNAQGEQQTYQYTNNLLTSITDNNGNVLSLSYNAINGFVDTITVAGQSIHYEYNTAVADPGFGNLLSVAYPATSGSGTVTRQYLYENTQFPWALTGIIDETGKRISTWGYDTQGLANSNNRAGSENFTIDYTHIADSGDPYSLVTNAKNYSWKYHLQTGGDGMVRVTRIEGLGSANCPAASNYTSYDGNAHPITVTDGNGNVTLRHYATNGQVDQLTEGYRWSSTPSGNVSELVESANMRKQIISAWDATNTWPITTIYSGKDASGSWIQYQRDEATYDSLGHGRIQTRTLTDLTNLTDPYSSNGRTRSWTYAYTYFDSAQTKINTLTVNGPGGANDQTINTYDNQGRLTQVSRKVSSALSLVTTYSQFNASGLPQQSTDPNGVVSQLSYDPRNRLKQVTTNVGANGARVTKIDYYESGLVKRVTLVKGGDGVSDAWMEYTYSDGVHLNRIDDNAGNYIVLTPSVLDGQWTKRQVYDNTGTLKQTQNRVFDELGRLLQIVAADNTTIRSSYVYQANGQLWKSMVGTDAATTTIRGLDYLNRLKTLTTPDSNSSQYAYDAQGNLAKVTDARGVITQYTYDGLGNLMKQQSPDSGTTKFVYDNVGNVTQKTDARGVVSNYTYDAGNRLTGITYPASTAENASFTYDSTSSGNKGIGRLTSYTNDGGTTALTYDAYGNIVDQAEMIGSQFYTTSYQYDNANRIVQIIYPSGRIVIYTRNALGQITQVQTKDSAAATAVTLINTASYEPFGPLKTLAFNNGVTTTFTHDADYRISRITTTATPNWDFIYSYDAAGNVTGLADQISTFSKTYGYDNLDRVISDINNTGTWSYQYDAGGNRTKRINSSTQTLTFDAASNRLTKNGTTTQTLDAAGNLTATGSKNYTYNNANHLNIATNSSGTVLSQATYNVFNQRTQKLQISKPMSFHYGLQGEVQDITVRYTSGTLYQRVEYVWLDAVPIAQIRTTYNTNGSVSTRRTTYVHADHLNTPRVMTDANKIIVWRWDGDAYGQTTPNENPDGDSTTDTLGLRFAGQYYDTETGLIYNANRYYDQTVGRYTQSDPIGLAGGLNRYAYVGGNPVKYGDPLGLLTEITIWQPVGWGESSFGHVSTDINGSTFSFGPNGMWNGSSSDYNSKNSFRDGTGLLINLTPEQEEKLKACLSGNQGNYTVNDNNCGKPVERCLKDLGIDTGSPLLPVDLGNRLIDSGATKGTVDHPATNPRSGTSAPWAR